MKKLTIITLAFTFLMIGACTEEETNELTISELKSLAQDQIVVDGTTLELRAYLWRDFMPISPPDGKNLISINWLVDVDSVAIPDNLLLDEQFVIHGDSLWSASYTNEFPETQPYIQERISRDGPKWEPNVEVTVISRVIDTSNGVSYYLIRENQQIVRTD